MRLCIFGSRDIMPSQRDISYAVSLLAGDTLPEEVVCGMAQGCDTAGRYWAMTIGAKVVEFPALWNTYGQTAGIVRNELMARYCTQGLCWWRKGSRGTANMIAWLTALEKPCKVVLL